MQNLINSFIHKKYSGLVDKLSKEAFYLSLDEKRKLHPTSQISPDIFFGTYDNKREFFSKNITVKMFENLNKLFNYTHLEGGQLFITSSNHLLYTLTNAMSGQANMPYFLHPQWASGNLTSGWQNHPISARLASVVFVPDLIRDLRVWKETKRIQLPIIGNLGSNSPTIPTYPLFSANFESFVTIFFFCRLITVLFTVIGNKISGKKALDTDLLPNLRDQHWEKMFLENELDMAQDFNVETPLSAAISKSYVLPVSQKTKLLKCDSWKAPRAFKAFFRHIRLSSRRSLSRKRRHFLFSHWPFVTEQPNLNRHPKFRYYFMGERPASSANWSSLSLEEIHKKLNPHPQPSPIKVGIKQILIRTLQWTNKQTFFPLYREAHIARLKRRTNHFLRRSIINKGGKFKIISDSDKTGDEFLLDKQFITKHKKLNCKNNVLGNNTSINTRVKSDGVKQKLNTWSSHFDNEINEVWLKLYSNGVRNRLVSVFLAQNRIYKCDRVLSDYEKQFVKKNIQTTEKKALSLLMFYYGSTREKATQIYQKRQLKIAIEIIRSQRECSVLQAYNYLDNEFKLKNDFNYDKFALQDVEKRYFPLWLRQNLPLMPRIDYGINQALVIFPRRSRKFFRRVRRWRKKRWRSKRYYRRLEIKRQRWYYCRYSTPYNLTEMRALQYPRYVKILTQSKIKPFNYIIAYRHTIMRARWSTKRKLRFKGPNFPNSFKLARQYYKWIIRYTKEANLFKSSRSPLFRAKIRNLSWRLYLMFRPKPLKLLSKYSFMHDFMENRVKDAFSCLLLNVGVQEAKKRWLLNLISSGASWAKKNKRAYSWLAKTLRSSEVVYKIMRFLNHLNFLKQYGRSVFKPMQKVWYRFYSRLKNSGKTNACLFLRITKQQCLSKTLVKINRKKAHRFRRIRSKNLYYPGKMVYNRIKLLREFLEKKIQPCDLKVNQLVVSQHEQRINIHFRKLRTEILQKRPSSVYVNFNKGQGRLPGVNEYITYLQSRSKITEKRRAFLIAKYTAYSQHKTYLGKLKWFKYSVNDMFNKSKGKIMPSSDVYRASLPHTYKKHIKDKKVALYESYVAHKTYLGPLKTYKPNFRRARWDDTTRPSKNFRSDFGKKPQYNSHSGSHYTKNGAR